MFTCKRNFSKVAPSILEVGPTATYVQLKESLSPDIVQISKNQKREKKHLFVISMIKTIIVLFTLSCLNVNVLGQSTEKERALEYRNLDKVFRSTFTTELAKDSTASYVFAIKVSLEDSGLIVESNDSILDTFFPALKSSLITQIDFKKILPRQGMKDVIIPIIISTIGTNSREHKMISEREALRNYNKLFYNIENLSDASSFIMMPRRIVADLETYH